MLKNIFKKNKNPNKVLFQRPKKKGFFERRNNFYITFDYRKTLNALRKNYFPYLLIFSLFLLVVTVFLLLGPIFRVEKINIYKKDAITNIDIAYKSVEDFRRESIFKIEESEIEERMKDFQKNIKSIKLTTVYPKTININVESYKEKFNININEKNYILLENGSLVPTIKPLENLVNLEIIREIDNIRVLDYKVVFDMNQIAKIEEITQKIKENIASIEITGLKYYQKERELHVILNDFTRLIFALEDISIDEQIKSLAVFDRENSQIANNDNFYIDLRIKGKIFYCSIKGDTNKQKERTCKNNLEYIYGQL